MGSDTCTHLEYLKENLVNLGIPPENASSIYNDIYPRKNDIVIWENVAKNVRPGFFDEAWFHAAELLYFQILKTFGESYSLYGNLGVLYFFWIRFDEAIYWFKKSLKINSNYLYNVMFEAFINLITTYLRSISRMCI